MSLIVASFTVLKVSKEKVFSGVQQGEDREEQSNADVEEIVSELCAFEEASKVDEHDLAHLERKKIGLGRPNQDDENELVKDSGEEKGEDQSHSL